MKNSEYMYTSYYDDINYTCNNVCGENVICAGQYSDGRYHFLDYLFGFVYDIKEANLCVEFEIDD